METQIIELLTMLGIGPTLASVIATVSIALLFNAKNKKASKQIDHSLQTNAMDISATLHNHALAIKEQIAKSSLEKEAIRLNQELLRENLELKAEVKRLKKQLTKVDND